MRKFYIFIVLSITCFISACNDDIDVAPGYPTIIEKKSSIEIDRVISQIEQTEMASCIVIDQFGYPVMSFDNEYCIDTENWNFNADIEKIKELAMEGFSSYGAFMEVSDTSEISLTSVYNHEGASYDEFLEEYPDSMSPVWIVSTAIQRYKDLEVRGTDLRILLSPDHVIGISGHWYTNITIPENDNFDEEAAKGLLLDKTFEYSRKTIIIKRDTNWHNSKKIIVPIVQSGQIELHVCWALYPDSWEILVDSQTGDILSSINISAY
ncbi:MAG: hypothetical protein PF436_00420 [Prolixibacteraceae bacterium]|nr:hypothetical protein [Prolixibacteraceae bacterium]